MKHADFIKLSIYIMIGFSILYYYINGYLCDLANAMYNNMKYIINEISYTQM